MIRRGQTTTFQERQDIGLLLALPAYQLALPFTHGAWRQLEYTHALTGTSF